MPNENLILTLGRPQGVETMVELPGFKVAARMPNNAGVEEIVTARIDAEGGSMPGRWYGYDAARAIVLDTNDRAGDVGARCAPRATSGRLGRARRTPGHFRRVRTGRSCATACWRRSCRLAERTGAGDVARGARPASQASTKQITPPGTRAGDGDEAPGSEGARRHGSGGHVQSASGRARLVRFRPGDVDHARRRPEAILRLARPVALLGQGPGPQASAGRSFGQQARRWRGRGFGRYGITDLSSQLRAGLEQFPGVKLIPFGWVAFFIFLYILLIGPGDYFFLKKVLKRMELTWITFPTIVLTVSLVAYYAAYVLKGNDLLVNKIDVVDIDQEAGIARGNTWISFFSPQNRDYSMHAIPTPLDAKDTPAAATGSGGDTARAPAGTEVVMSWFSVPEDQFAAMGNSSRRFSFGGSGYAYEPVGGVEFLENVRIPIWSTKCITAQWFGPAAPLVESDLQQAGNRPRGRNSHKPSGHCRLKTRFSRTERRSICSVI